MQIGKCKQKMPFLKWEWEKYVFEENLGSSEYLHILLNGKVKQY
jgi:hypothetical protein